MLSTNGEGRQRIELEDKSSNVAKIGLTKNIDSTSNIMTDTKLSIKEENSTGGKTKKMKSSSSKPDSQLKKEKQFFIEYKKWKRLSFRTTV